MISLFKALVTVVGLATSGSAEITSFSAPGSLRAGHNLTITFADTISAIPHFDLGVLVGLAPVLNGTVVNTTTPGLSSALYQGGQQVGDVYGYFDLSNATDAAFHGARNYTYTVHISNTTSGGEYAIVAAIPYYANYGSDVGMNWLNASITITPATQ